MSEGSQEHFYPLLAPALIAHSAKTHSGGSFVSEGQVLASRCIRRVSPMPTHSHPASEWVNCCLGMCDGPCSSHHVGDPQRRHGHQHDAASGYHGQTCHGVIRWLSGKALPNAPVHPACPVRSANWVLGACSGPEALRPWAKDVRRTVAGFVYLLEKII